MLTLTENAATAVRSIVSQVPDTADGGLRIRGNGTPDAGYELAVVPAAEAGDAVVEQSSARVFVDQQAALQLDDKILDAEVGQDGSVRFALASQG
jgi:iron-sulfur cluster assembly protein